MVNKPYKPNLIESLSHCAQIGRTLINLARSEDMQYAVDEFNIVHRKRICDANIKYTINLIDEFEAFYSLQFIKCDFRFKSQDVKIFIKKQRNRNH